jgi:hypothetical protein
VERERRAVEDSTRFKVVLAAKTKAEATRDSLYQQVAIIKSIDASRYLWPHLLDEISSSLPPYTWLTSVSQTSSPPSSVALDSIQQKAAAAQAAKGVKPKPLDAKTRKHTLIQFSPLPPAPRSSASWATLSTSRP